MWNWARRLRRFARLVPSERRLVLRALAVHAGVRLKLWRHGLDIRQSMEPHGAHRQPGAGPDVEPKRLTQLVSSAIRQGPVAGNCLSESITICVLLRQAGHEGTLRIGARRSDTGLEAHAWVELNGAPLNDRVDIAERFTPFLGSLEPSQRWVG
jgi:hypothetical protein